MRTIEHGGTWWTQGPDGRWAKWSHVFGDWEPTDGPPLDPPPAREGEPSPPFRPIPQPLPAGAGLRPSAAEPVLEYLGTLLRLMLPGLLLGVAVPFLFLLSLMFLFLSDRGFLPPSDNVKAILIWSATTGPFVAGAIVAVRHLGGDRSGERLRWAISGGIVAVGLPLAWLATGDAWSGTAGSKAATLGVVLLLGLGVEVLHRRGVRVGLRWRSRGRAHRSPFTFPG